jgi:hypothetical protein
MRLLHRDSNGGFSLANVHETSIPSYAILSHTWGTKDDLYRTHDNAVRNAGRSLHSWYRSVAVPATSTRVFEIPSIITATHRRINALGDTCAKKNFMRSEYAARLGLRIDHTAVSTVYVGSGRQVTTIGTVKTLFRFVNEPETYELVFHLIPDCIHDVILGKAFLKATRTFSLLVNLVRRVVERVISGLSDYHCLYLGTSAPTFTGLINGQKQQALADSGCKVLIMDEDYARSAGLPIIDDAQNRTRLRFADGSTSMTSGMTYAVDWQFGPSPGDTDKVHSLDFHILKNAPASVILSDELLFDTNAFAEFDCYLVDEDDEDDDAYFLLISVDHSHNNNNDNNTPNFADALRHRELIRQADEDDRIANLPTTEQAEANTIELARRAQWVNDMRNQQLSTASSSSTGVSSSTGLSPTPNTPNTNSGPSKRSWWRFKLKRRNPP